LNDFKPPKNSRVQTESILKQKWVAMLNATNPGDDVDTNVRVWPMKTGIDVFRKTRDEKIIIYELKVGTGEAIHLYQLKMYWDGLVLNKPDSRDPSEAYLFVEDYDPKLEDMANEMNNKLNPPGKNRYNFKVMKHKDVGLGTEAVPGKQKKV
jgi:hypothetical protein